MQPVERFPPGRGFGAFQEPGGAMRPYAPVANPPATFFSFAFPDSSVEIHFSVMRDLEVIAGGEGDSAAWGLLLGHRTGSGESVVVEAAEPVPSTFGSGYIATIQHWQPNPERRLYAVGYYRCFNYSQNADVDLLPAENELIHQWFTGTAVAFQLRRCGAKVTGRLWNIMPEAEPGALEFPIRSSFANIDSVAPAAEGAIPYGRPVIPYAQAGIPYAWPNPGAPRRSRASHLSKWLWPILGAAALAGAFLAYWSITQHAQEDSARPGIAQQTTGPLELNLEPVNDDVNLTWNPGAKGFTGAHGAVLWVTEDGVSRNLVLDATKLQTGSLLYSPSGANIMFRMEVFGGNERAEESVRLLRTGAPQGSMPATRDQGTRTFTSGQELATRERTAPIAQSPLGDTGREIRTVRTFVAPKKKAAEQRSAAISAPPSVPLTSSTPQVEALPEAVRSSGSRAPTLPAATASQPAVSTPQAPPVVSNLVPPRPLYREQPRLTQTQLLGAPSVVSVDVDIDERGTVVNAALAAGQRTSTLLANEMMRAAARWRFSPAELNGRKIPSKMVLQFLLSPRR